MNNNKNNNDLELIFSSKVLSINIYYNNFYSEYFYIDYDFKIIDSLAFNDYLINETIDFIYPILKHLQDKKYNHFYTLEDIKLFTEEFLNSDFCKEMQDYLDR